MGRTAISPQKYAPPLFLSLDVSPSTSHRIAGWDTTIFIYSLRRGAVVPRSSTHSKHPGVLTGGFAHELAEVSCEESPMWNRSHLESLISSDMLPPVHLPKPTEEPSGEVMRSPHPLFSNHDFPFQTWAFLYSGKRKVEEFSCILPLKSEPSAEKPEIGHGAERISKDRGSPPPAAHTIMADKIGQHSSPLFCLTCPHHRPTTHGRFPLTCPTCL
jgi:hypothetical protein